MVEVLGWFGAALSCLLSIPQALRVLRAERLDGISPGTYWIVLINAAVWALWSLFTGEHAAGVPALINGPAAILILRRLVITRSASGGASSLGPDVRLTVHEDHNDGVHAVLQVPRLGAGAGGQAGEARLTGGNVARAGRGLDHAEDDHGRTTLGAARESRAEQWSWRPRARGR